MSLNSLYAEDDLFNCCICMNHFDDGLRKPKLLPCHHTFCKTCIHSMIESTSLSGLACPLCNASFCITTVDALQSNVYLDKFKDLMKYRSINLIENSFNCYECAKHRNTEMFFWCKSCSLPVCTHCLAIDHVEAKGHVVEDLNQVTQKMQRQALDSVANLLAKVNEINIKKVNANSLQNPALGNTILALTQGFGASKQSLDRSICGNLLDPGNQLTAIKNLNILQRDAVSLVKINKNIQDMTDYMATIENFLNQKLLECQVLSKSSIMTSVIRSDVRFDYGRIYCMRCGDFCNIPKKISASNGPYGVPAIEHSCVKCKIIVVQFH